MPRCRVRVIRISLCNVSFSDRSLCFFTDPNVLFLVDSLIYGKEDSDILLVCPLTDPDVSNFTLKKCDGKPLPKNMMFIPNPQKGIIIKNVQRSFKGCYQCLAKHNGVEKISENIFLNVRPGNTEFSPSCRAPDIALLSPRRWWEVPYRVSWPCHGQLGVVALEAFWSLLLLKARCACVPGSCSVMLVTAAHGPEEGGGLGNLVLGELCEGTSWSHNIWLVAVLSRFGHDHFYLLFLVISRF